MSGKAAKRRSAASMNGATPASQWGLNALCTSLVTRTATCAFSSLSLVITTAQASSSACAWGSSGCILER